jgi:adenosine deaminase
VIPGALAGRLAALPKAEMHVHLEGAVRWRTIRELHPAGASLPARPPWLEPGRGFPDFDDFRQVFRDYVRPVAATPSMIERLAFEVTEDLAAQNVRYAELIVSPDLYTAGGLGRAEAWAAIVRGRDRAAARYPIDARLVLGISRHRPVAYGLASLEEIAGVALDRGWLSGIDLQGDERLGDGRAFVDVFRLAARLGLKLRAHAGELCGPASVRDAVVACGAVQISHGVRAVEEPALVAELARRRVVLHVCPTSNVMLGCARDHATHPLRALRAAGVACTVNSDDPLLFGCDITSEYAALVTRMGLSPADVGDLARTAFRASLLAPEVRETFCAEIDAWAASGGRGVQ